MLDINEYEKIEIIHQILNGINLMFHPEWRVLMKFERALEPISFLDLHPSHVPYSMSTIVIRHDTNKIDPDFFQIDFIFRHIEHNSSFHGSFLCYTECIEWMTIILVFPILDLYKYSKSSSSHNDIYFPSFHLIITIYYCVFFGF